MAIVNRHAAGSFSWIELGTTDQAGAKTFYSSLLGWTCEDYPTGPDEYYTIFLLNGHTVAAAQTLRKEQLAKHVPPHWNAFVAVAAADETVRRAAELGATVLTPAFDMAEYGRMAVLRDPTGAVFSVWQAKSHIGVSVHGEPGSLCWVELNTGDTAAATSFYSALFGWTVEERADLGGYSIISNGDVGIGGMSALREGCGPHWMTYLCVADCAGTTARARELGARIEFGPTPIENVGTITVLADPQGAVVALIEPRPAA